MFGDVQVKGAGVADGVVAALFAARALLVADPALQRTQVGGGGACREAGQQLGLEQAARTEDSRASSGVGSATRAPALGTRVTRSSLARRISTCRIRVRETPKAWPSSSSRKRGPGARRWSSTASAKRAWMSASVSVALIGGARSSNLRAQPAQQHAHHRPDRLHTKWCSIVLDWCARAKQVHTPVEPAAIQGAAGSDPKEPQDRRLHDAAAQAPGGLGGVAMGGRRCWTNRASSAPGGACCTRRIRWRRSLRTWASRTRATSAAASVAGTAARRAPCAGCTATEVGSPALQRLFTRLSGPVCELLSQTLPRPTARWVGHAHAGRGLPVATSGGSPHGRPRSSGSPAPGRRRRPSSRR